MAARRPAPPSMKSPDRKTQMSYNLARLQNSALAALGAFAISLFCVTAAIGPALPLA